MSVDDPEMTARCFSLRAMCLLFCGCIVSCLVSGVGSGCSTCSSDDQYADGVASESAHALVPLADPPNTIVVTDLYSRVTACDVYHRGAVHDLGSPSTHGRFGYDLSPSHFGDEVIRDGATWLRVGSGVLSLNFRQMRTESVFVEARIRGLDSKSASVRIDGRDIGTLRFARDEPMVVATPATGTALSAGAHVVSLQFRGRKRDRNAAEVDWIRVGVPDHDMTTFAAPTLRDLATDAAIGGHPYRTLALRAPGLVRCAVALSDTMSFHAAIGYSGSGGGEARIEVSELGDSSGGLSTSLLHVSKLAGDDRDVAGAKRVDIVDLPMGGFAGKIVAFDLIASETSPGGRVLFGEPVFRIRDPRMPEREDAKVVLIVVLTGANLSHLPGYSDVSTMPVLSSLLAESVVFHRHRAPSTVVAGSVASLLTGQSPAQHMVTDTGARLGDMFQTLGSIARDGRASSGMFTGNPSTFEAFGMNKGWTKFASFSPVSGTSAGAPIREAHAWTEELLENDKHRRVVVVVHARGGHPPWTGSESDFATLPPPDYSGGIVARRGGQILARERNHRFGSKPMPQEDRIRVEAFAQLGLKSDDAQLGLIVDMLRQRKVWDSTLLVVTSDVAMGGGKRIPFGDGELLGEDVLSIPLIVRFPGKRFGGSHVYAPTNAVDVTRTAIVFLGLDPPDGSSGRNLLEIAAHPGRFPIHPQFALNGAAYSTRWGDWILSGTPPRVPFFCLSNPDRDCEADPASREPFLAAWTWRMTREHLSPNTITQRREPATLDADTVAALTVWGSLEPEPQSPKSH